MFRLRHFASLVAFAVTALTTSGSAIADDRPDLSGTYNAATLTPIVRPKHFGDNLYLTPEQAEKMAADAAAFNAASNRTSDPNRTAPPAGGDGSPGAAGNVGGYNNFWIDRGSEAMTVDGKFRTSIIVSNNGQFPEMTPAARKARAERVRMASKNEGVAWWGDGPGPYDNMEQRGTGERCLLSFSGATPSFPSLYNNFKRIVQTDDYVMILIEMVHDARIVRLNSEHQPERKWLGDSIGWWEDDTLVVETINFHPMASRDDNTNQKVTERFSRLDNGDLLYRFTVENPDVWVEPWTGEYVWRASDEKIYEYACHEGNYALGNIMRGARILEQDARAAGGGN